MNQIQGKYIDNLRCEMVHPSSTVIRTDAPKDNRGEGKFFSPTDLVAAALGSCMLTIIGIRARDKGINIGNPDFEIVKHMQSNPRKISKIEVKIKFFSELNEDERAYLENEGRKCPVALSISEEIEQDISFEYA
ncbi:MAG: osmotically inducible protein OsmC [Flavobacteriales bacterium]|nr:osmotically inducible protein OsmC [Flavobacteriales bacterium]|tara:strand:+ start:498 stop:899 length:402 start_codon:yes stop_codon:yes gene_type:complete